MHKVILLLTVFTFSLQAQSLLELYKPLIPLQILEDEDHRNNTSSLFQEVIKYEPSLIYNFIEYLKALQRDPIEARGRLADFNYVRNEYFKRMNGWISNEFDLSFSRTVNFSQWARIWSYLFMLKSGTSDNNNSSGVKYPVDENFRFYILHLFFKDTYVEYNEAAEYRPLLEKQISGITETLTDVYNNISAYSEEKLEYYFEYAKDHPYLFQGIVLDYVKQPVPVYLTEFLVKLSANEYRLTNLMGAGLQAETFNEQRNYTAVFNDDRFTTLSEFTDIKRNKISYGAEISIMLKEYKSWLSCINISLFAGAYEGTLSAPQINFRGNPFYIVYTNNGSTRVDPNFTTGSFNYSSHSYQLKLSTPLAYFLSSLSMNAGVHFRYSMYKYKSTYQRDDEYNPNWNNLSESVLTSYSQEVELMNEILNVYPFISADYMLLNLMNFRLSATLNMAIQLEFFINFPF